jgi:hypothetical protein
MTTALTCVLSVTALAGEMPTCGVTSPPPDETAQQRHRGIPSTGVTSPGDMPTCGLSVLLTAFGLVF